jgi:type III restriction enzyme
LETAIYITEAAKKCGDVWIENELRDANNTSNPGLSRIALKMATGAEKSVVAAMLIAWQALNKLANTKDARFTYTFLIITPGITIRDRLRVLLPNDPQNYYRQRDVVSSQLLAQLGQAKILITNYHAFQPRETIAEIEEFKAEYRARFPGRDADKLTDEDLLREVMNTVGKAGKLGEHVKCVVSVSMLTEGWDANTVTHILGVRAFGTQLLCEQVVGRGLRRMSYAADDKGMYTPEYAEVYGVPFSFIPCSGSVNNPQPGPLPTRVRALENRIACEIAFPRLVGYRYELPGEQLPQPVFDADAELALSTADIPTQTENAPIVGETSIHKLDDLKRRRPSEIAFLLAKLTLEKYFRQDGQQQTVRPEEHHFDGEVKAWLFPQMLAITKRWLAECVTLKDNTFPQLLLLIEFAHDAADRIYKAIVKGSFVSGIGFQPVTGHGQDARATPRLLPMLRPYDALGSTRYVDFDTTRPTFATREDKCHISHVVADTDTWEQKLAQTLENMPEVVRYVKNHNLGFTIPYTLAGGQRQYVPDFIAVIRGTGFQPMSGHWQDASATLNLLIEVTGEKKKDKAAKVATARNLWAPAVNNHGGFGRWQFVEIDDPWDAENLIRAAIRQGRT